MGAWGTGINQNDNFSDVYDEFIDLYNDGHSVNEITSHLIADNQESINSNEYSNDFWFAIASSQWECKELDKAVYEMVEQIIISGENLKLWQEQDATQATLKKREIALNKFLEKLKTEKAKPRRRVKKKYYDSVFNEGDCLTYKLENGNYGGAFVLTEEKEKQHPKNFIAITNINQPEKPISSDFKDSYVLYERYEHPVTRRTDGGPLIGFFMQYEFKYIDFQIEVVGNLTTNKTFKKGNPIYGFNWKKLQLSDQTILRDWTVIDNKKIGLKKWLKRKKIFGI